MLKKASFLSRPTLARRDAPFPNKAAGESKPEAYPLGRMVRRIRSTTSVRAAESVGGRVPVEDFDEPRTKLTGFFSSLL